MRAGQDADFRRDGANDVAIAAIDALALVEDLRTHRGVLDFLEFVGDFLDASRGSFSTSFALTSSANAVEIPAARPALSLAFIAFAIDFSAAAFTALTNPRPSWPALPTSSSACRPS